MNALRRRGMEEEEGWRGSKQMHSCDFVSAVKFTGSSM
jgi:hypothetical protein